jgi:pyrimidine operon attenuation protein/uracil phosphoribosyltransferase
MAHEIVERNRNLDDFVIIGVMTRGAVLAERLSAELNDIAKTEAPVGSMDVALYRDDYESKGPVMPVKVSEIPFSIDGKTVLLVDDVFFTGRTISAAIRHLFDLGRPKKIQLAVLIDRGHRELPFRPDYCGKNVPTQYVEKIRVRFLESDGKDIVLSGLDEQPSGEDA